MMDAQEVAERLKVHPRTVNRLLERGELVGYKVANQWRISEEDFQAYLARIRNVKPQTEE
jgi:excisionase family DNA binding protein